MLFTALKQMPLIAILRGIKPTEVIQISQSLINAGFTCIEVPLNSPEAFVSIQKLAKEFGQQILIGAGTVIDPEQVKKVAEHGGQLIVTPHTQTNIIKAAKDLKLVCVSGFFTASEAFSAINAGADALKLFPAEAADAKVLKALKAVLPTQIPILPVGGITPEKMSDYVKAGAAGFGLGSALYQPNDSAEIVSQKAKSFITMAQQLKLAQLFSSSHS